MYKRFTASPEAVEALGGDIRSMLEDGDFTRLTISDAELERCSGRCRQAMENAADFVLKAYLLGAANAYEALTMAGQGNDHETMFDRVTAMWLRDTGDLTEQALREGGA